MLIEKKERKREDGMPKKHDPKREREREGKKR